MRTQVCRFALATAAFLALMSGRSARAQSAPVTITDLGSLGGTFGLTQVTGMNDLGMVVGYSSAARFHGFAWTPAGGTVDLGTLPGGGDVFAYGVNNSGQVVGMAADSTGAAHAFIWSKSGGLVDLGIGPNGAGATARCVNSKGWVAGDFESYTAPSGRHAFFWSASTGMKDLGSLGGSYLTTTALNDSGIAVGWGYTADGYIHAFASKAKVGPLKDLGTFGGNTSSAAAINNSNQITGNATLATGESRAFIYSNNKMTDILGIPSSGAAINDSGMVVGQATFAGVGSHAFAYTSHGGVVDLGTLFSTSSAVSVSANGHVTGTTDTNLLGTQGYLIHAFVWTAATGMKDAGSPDDYGNSQGIAINSDGQMAGMAVDHNTDQKGFFLDPTAGRTNIAAPGWTQSSAVALNGAGMVVGSSLNPAGYTRAFIWTSGGGMTELPTPAHYHSSAVGINDLGQVIGHYNLLNDYTQGFLWSGAAGWQPILAGGYFTTLVAINRSGQILGYGIDAGFQSVAFLRKVDGTMVSIPPINGQAMQPLAFNDSGKVVGQYYAGGSVYHAFTWTEAGGTVDLGAVSAVAINAGGDYTGTYTLSSGLTHAYLQKVNGARKDLGALVSGSSGAVAINDSDQVIGLSGASDGTHGFFYDNQMRDMGSLGGGFSDALAMNSVGQAVGWSYTAAGLPHGFVWSRSSGILDLGTLGGPNSKAVAINASGQAAGEAVLADQSLHAALWKTK